MKHYQIIKVFAWTEKGLIEKAQNLANEKSREGYEIVCISFAYGCYAYLTIARAQGYSFQDKM